jgi:hypothetical protein
MATLLVNDVTPRVQYTATGAQTVFAYGFSIFVDADLKVYKGSTLMTLSAASNNTSYQVSGAATTAGGNVTFGAGLTGGDIVTIYRDLPVSRTSDYQTGGDLLAETLNDDLDKIVQMVQQGERDINQRTLRFGQFTTGIPLAEFTESATDRANKVLGFDSSGDPNITQELGTFQGNWAASTAYVIRDLVKDTSNNNIYICTVAHTSSGSQPLSSNTDVAKWSLIVDSASATTSATAAATSATASATSATASATSATAAATSATAGATSATASATSATAGATSASAAATSATAAAASYDSFDDRYLGTKSSDPTVDNDGATLLDGALYFNTTNNVMMVYDLGGTTWNRTTPTTSDQTKINTVSGIAANVTTVAGISSDVTATAGKATEIGLLGVAAVITDMGILGTADVVADMNTLGTADVVTDMNTLGTADVVVDMNTLGTADVVADMNTLGTADVVVDMNTLGTAANVTAMDNCSGSITNINTCATNLTNINSFANTYTIAGSAPGSPGAGDLWYDTSLNKLNFYTGSAWTEIAPGITTEVDPSAAALALALG